jgi:predicted dehydrogenase
MKPEVSRRDFVGGTAAAAVSAGPAVVSALGANEKLQVAFIGMGGRGRYVMDMMYKAAKDHVVVTAVCETFQPRLAAAKDFVQTNGGNTPETYVDYKEMLAKSKIDVVFVTSPEHLHHPMAMAALAAGKHIYLEKPLAHTIEEGWDIVKASKKSGKVLQVGTQNRSNSLYIKAKEMVAKGMIGEIHYVRAFWYRNALPDGSPAWRYAIPADATEQNTDWARFLGPAQKRPFNKNRYYQWRLYWDYSGGISTDLLVHQTDITNFVCGKTVPQSCMASGGVYQWVSPDDRDVPDTFSALYEYPDRFQINYSCFLGNAQYGYGEQFMGREGTIEVLNRQILNFYVEKVNNKPIAQAEGRKEFNETLPGNDNLAVQSHVRNLIETIQGKAQLVAPVEVGQQAAIGGHMATLSYRNKKMVVWEDKKNTYRFI